jgi:predicted RNA-binding protein
MCEFNVYLDETKVFEDAIFCRVLDGKLLLKDILGQTKEFVNCHIVEVDVTKEKLILKYDL